MFLTLARFGTTLLAGGASQARDTAEGLEAHDHCQAHADAGHGARPTPRAAGTSLKLAQFRGGHRCGDCRDYRATRKITNVEARLPW